MGDCRDMVTVGGTYRDPWSIHTKSNIVERSFCVLLFMFSTFYFLHFTFLLFAFWLIHFHFLLFTWISLVRAACGRCETWKWHHRFSIDRLFQYFLFSPQQRWSHLTLEKSRWDCWPACIIPSMDIRFEEAEIQMWVSYWWSANHLVYFGFFLLFSDM